MTTELYWLTLTALMTALFWVPYVLNRVAATGLGATLAGSAPDAGKLAEWAQRAIRAHGNAIESFAIFAPLVLTAHLLGISTPATKAAVVVYFFAYLVSNAGAFAAVSALYRDETKPHPVAMLAGAGRRSPFAAAVFTLCLLSLAGIPATAGFVGKFFLFKAALEKGLYALAIIGVLNSLVSIGYYLKVVYVLYMRDPVEDEGPPALAPADRLALALCAAGILVLGVFPSFLWELARRAAATLPFSGP